MYAGGFGGSRDAEIVIRVPIRRVLIRQLKAAARNWFEAASASPVFLA